MTDDRRTPGNIVALDPPFGAPKPWSVPLPTPGPLTDVQLALRELSSESTDELYRLAGVGRQTEDAIKAKAAQPTDLERVAFEMNHLKFRDHMKMAAELWGEKPPTTAAEMAAALDTWTQANKRADAQ